MTQQRPRTYRKSGVFALKRTMKERGMRAIDGRSAAARAIKEWRADVERDLGGAEALSRQQETLLDMAAAAVFLLGTIDAWIAARPEMLVNSRQRSVAPIVRERVAVANHLAGLLRDLGLERKAKEAPTLAQYLAQRSATASPPDARRSPTTGDREIRGDTSPTATTASAQRVSVEATATKET